MTPLLFRPFLQKTTTETMINSQQNSPRHPITSEASHGPPINDTCTTLKSYKNVSRGMDKRTSRDFKDDEISLTCCKVPKIILHRTHPPSFPIHKGSRFYYRSQKHREDAAQIKPTSSLKPVVNDRHCKCCSKKVETLHKSFV